ncbi:hypothetical protein CEXT_83051 [Caerostris extrusa]|uniref:Secreted protein n=1 Tax=Caerostris extrusa TaxID=172846 RepID=A0AAV4SIA6_CAEEX|nr:hypothetical protein CEXT_83051 [Caerostris extrusa]
MQVASRVQRLLLIRWLVMYLATTSTGWLPYCRPLSIFIAGCCDSDTCQFHSCYPVRYLLLFTLFKCQFLPKSKETCFHLLFDLTLRDRVVGQLVGGTIEISSSP